MTMQDRPQSGWERHGVSPGMALQVFGMRRSGNHAIVDWMMRNAPGETALFFNNCKMGADPVDSFASFEQMPPPDAPARHGKKDRKARWRAPDLAPSLVVVSYEDAVPPGPGQADWASRGYRRGDFDAKVLIYRSFLNWAASLLRKIQRNPDYGPLARLRIMTRAVDLYGEALDRIGIEGIVPISYDDWMASDAYRGDVLGQLGLPCRDNSHGKVQRFGGGSSFQGRPATPEALKTDARAAQMADDREYLTLLWTVAQDDILMPRLVRHFPEDARRLRRVAETAHVDIRLEALQ